MKILDEITNTLQPAKKFLENIVIVDGDGEPNCFNIPHISRYKKTIRKAVNELRVPFGWLCQNYPATIAAWRFNGIAITPSKIKWTQVEPADFERTANRRWLKARAGQAIQSLRAIESFNANQLRDTCPEERHLFAD